MHCFCDTVNCGESQNDYCLSIFFGHTEPSCIVQLLADVKVCPSSTCQIQEYYYEEVYFGANVNGQDCSSTVNYNELSFLPPTQQTTLLVYPSPDYPIGSGYPFL